MKAEIQLNQVKDKIILLTPIINPPDLPESPWALQSPRISPSPEGLNLNIPQIPPVPFKNINYISIFQLMEQGPSQKYLDIYVSSYPGPFRAKINQIVYSAFFETLKSRLLQTLHLFILNLIDKAGVIYLDEHTMSFLETGEWKEFKSKKELEQHNWGIWTRITDSGKQICKECKKYFWVNIVVPESAQRTVCRNCEKEEKQRLLQNLVPSFGEFLLARAQKTTNMKMDEIDKFKQYLGEKDLLEAVEEDLTEYLKSIDLIRVGGLSLRKRELIIHEFFEYCFSIGLIEKNPFM